MIHFYHNSKTLVKLTDESGKELAMPLNKKIINQFFEVASRYPEDRIIWIKESIVNKFNKQELVSYFKDNNYMLSLGDIKNQFLVPEIGYVTDGPFIAVSEKVIYPTWLMQDTAGMVAAAVINQFDVANYKNVSLEYLLTSVSRIGQPQGLFCYHIPLEQPSIPITPKNTRALFKFVVQHYKRSWSLLLFFLLFRYENLFAFYSFSKAQSNSKFKIEFKIPKLKTSFFEIKNFDYDVVIPTMGRRDYLKDVLIDLSKQDNLPSKVVVVEQNSDQNSRSELNYIDNSDWPFIIDHCFTHQTGACNARNIALEKVNATWVLLFDDDVRIDKDFISSIAKSINETDVKAMTFACLQEGERESRKAYLQWENFGSGCSVVHKETIRNCKFDMVLEHGYGEDSDFGMQLRNLGYDVIYAPQIHMDHLKAPIGGFRSTFEFKWQNDAIQPKPSPHILYHRRKNFTREQLKGYKITLFFKFYFDQSIKNPFTYFNYFKKAWKNSLYWSNLLAQDATN
jgi:GT2 family glycosyltransferase